MKWFKILLTKFLITPIICLCQGTTKVDTLPRMPAHYALKVKQFKNEPIETNRIVFLGNSITEGGKWGTLLNEPTILNRGIGGDVTYGILNRLDEVIARKPSHIFILIGINDIGNGIPVEKILSNYQQIITRIKAGSASSRIFIQSVLPVNNLVSNFPSDYNKNTIINKLNNALLLLTKKENVEFIDLHSLFKDKEGNLNKSYTYDGLHLNNAGYQIWAGHLLQKGYLNH